jgi:predicted nucleic acid-binding protein
MATMDDNPLFIDTNILVYANVIETPFHEQALAAINAAHEAGRTIWISRQVIREYLVTLTRPQVFENLPRATVLEQVDQFIERFQVVDDTATVSKQLVKLMSDFKIVATMLAYDIPCLLTHNVKDFWRFGEVVRIEGIDS